MYDLINNLIANIAFIFERLNWLSVLDILLVTAIVFAILLLLRGTQAEVLLRGVLLLIALVGVLTSLEVLPAFSYLVRTALPALVFAIPVIFAPEIRHALERLGRAGVNRSGERIGSHMHDTVQNIVSAAVRLSDRQHGALIVMQRQDNLDQYIQTGIRLDARVTPELLLQVFYPNTPLHDGAVIISGRQMIAAACVMPLSASGVLESSPDHQMGLRHRAALGISEHSDAVALVVSEETGAISVVQGGRFLRRLDADRLLNVLRTFFPPEARESWFRSIINLVSNREGSDKGNY